MAKKQTRLRQSRLERSKRAQKIGDSFDLPSQKNFSAEGERHGTSHQLQQPIRRQRDSPPHSPYPRMHSCIHTPPKPHTKNSRVSSERPPIAGVPLSISGLVVAIHYSTNCCARPFCFCLMKQISTKVEGLTRIYVKLTPPARGSGNPAPHRAELECRRRAPGNSNIDEATAQAVVRDKSAPHRRRQAC